MRNDVFQRELSKETAVSAFLDLTNMFHWQGSLGWKFVVKDVVHQLAALAPMKEVRVYYGFNGRDPDRSAALHKRIRGSGAIVVQKPVKWIRREINESMFFKQATRSSFSADLSLRVTEFVQSFRETGILIEEPKCNFDVELTMDLLDALEKVSAVVLFSGDSDLVAPLERLKIKGKRVYVCCIRGHIANELIRVSDGFINFGHWYTGQRLY